MKIKPWIFTMLLGLPVGAGAEELGAYAGVGLGEPSVAYGSSNMAFRILGGYKIHEFPLKNAGVIELAIQGEYVDFGNSTFTAATTWTNTGMSLAGIGSWVIPKKWADWADEKLSVIVKVGGARVATKSNWGASFTYTGLTEGVGAEYRFTKPLGVRAMIENYPNGYQILGVSGIFHF